MRRKGRKVVKPAGSELMDYLNKGYAICNKCGAVMDRKEDPEGGCDIYSCPSCGWEIEELDYEYDNLYGEPQGQRYDYSHLEQHERREDQIHQRRRNGTRTR